MNTIIYTISRLDTYYCDNEKDSFKAKIDAEERGRRLLREIKALFPNRERITEHGPHKSEGFIPYVLGKSYTYHDPYFIINIYKKFEKIPRKGESINYLEIIISSFDKSLLDEKKEKIDEIISKHTKNIEDKINKTYTEKIE